MSPRKDDAKHPAKRTSRGTRETRPARESRSESRPEIRSESRIEYDELPRPLTLKEKNVLEFIEGFIREHGISPSYQEICSHFGFASFNSVQRYLKQLEEKGYVHVPGGNQKRALSVLRSASSLQETLGELQREAQPYAGQSVGSSVNSQFVGSQSGPQSMNQQAMSQQMGQPLQKQSVRNVLSVPSSVHNELFTLPLLGRVAAGSPIEAYEHDEFIDVPASLVRHAERTYALRVQGQSMIEDGIFDGDVILVQRQAHAANGEIVVAMVGEEATVKRFYVHHTDPRQDRPDGTGKGLRRIIELRPANSSMSSLWFDPDEVQIRGVLVGLIRKF